MRSFDQGFSPLKLLKLEVVKVSKTIVTLILFLALPNLNAFAEPAPPRKDPSLSSILSGCLLPGTGQFYNGEIGKGALYIIVETVSLGLMIVGTEDNVEFLGEQIDVDDDDGTAGFGFLVWVANRIISAVDAGTSAKKINQQKTVSVSPIGSKGRRGIMLSLRF